MLTIRLWRPFEFTYDEKTKELKATVPNVGKVTFVRVENNDPLETVQKKIISEVKESGTDYTVKIKDK